MRLELIYINWVVTERALRDVFNTEVVVQLKFGFLHGFATILDHEIHNLPVVTNLLRVFCSHSHESGLGLSFLSKPILSGPKIRHGRPHVFVLLHVHLQFFILLLQLLNFCLCRSQLLH